MVSTGARLVSLLYDTLVHPNAETGSPGRSKLRWIYDPGRAVSHLVVAQTAIGGSWNTHDDDVKIRCELILAKEQKTVVTVVYAMLFFRWSQSV